MEDGRVSRVVGELGPAHPRWAGTTVQGRRWQHEVGKSICPGWSLENEAGQRYEEECREVDADHSAEYGVRAQPGYCK